MKRSTLLFFFLSIVLLLAYNPVNAQASNQITDVRVDHTYGQSITFTARIKQPESIKDIFLFFEVEGDQDPFGSLIIADPNGLLKYTYDVGMNPIRPFAIITYWYIINLQSGETLKSQEYNFQYIDNRYPWQTLKSDSVEVNWYTDEMDIGKDAFDVLHQSILRISNLISISLNDPVQLFLYGSQDALQESLSLGGLITAGPDLQVLIVSKAPEADQKTLIEQEIPTELAHLLLYRKTGITYILIPVWLQEGIAGQVEASPNPTFDFMLADAVEKQTLIPLGDLCATFPQGPDANLLAFSQARSFTRFLFNKYGQAGLDELILAYTSGLDCEQGAKMALGKTLSQLEFDWLQATFNKNALWQTFLDFLPYLTILLLILFIPLLNKPQKQDADDSK